MPTPRVTLSHIAAKAGVHATTVSLALRNSPRLPADTRERIQALAREMGYQPDPVLSALNAYRTQLQTPVFQSTLAWFNPHPVREEMLDGFCFSTYLAGATQRATELGYKLEEVWLHEPKLTLAAVARRLLAKGVQGILVFPQNQIGPLEDFQWEEFSALALGYSVTAPGLHRVTSHHFASYLNILRELRALGYRRIGLFLPEEYDRRVNFGVSSAYAAYNQSIPDAERVPVMVQRSLEDLARLGPWIDEHGPEVILSQNNYFQEWLGARGQQVPADIGLAYLHIAKDNPVLSGGHQNDHGIGRAAVDFLVSMLHRNERGVPAIAQHVLSEGGWVPGTTVRRVGPPAPWFLDQTPIKLPNVPPPPAPPVRSDVQRLD